MKTKFRHIGYVVLIALAAVVTLALLIPAMQMEVQGIPATSVMLTDLEGNTVQLTDQDVQEATYSWVAETATLTLNGYSGRKITTNGDINLHLKGTNTLTMDPDAESGVQSALYLDYNMVQITADEGGVLNVRGDLKTYFTAVCGSVNMVSGTLDINVTSASDYILYGIERSLTYDSSSENATVNITVNRTVESNSFIYGVYNQAQFQECGDVGLSISLTGAENDTIVGVSTLLIYESGCKIKIDLDNGAGDDVLLKAAESCQGISLTEGGKVELGGYVESYSLPMYTNKNTVTTTPANNQYVWIETDGQSMHSSDFVLSNLDGTPCLNAVFEYSAEPAKLTWVGDGWFSIPASVVEDNASLNLQAGIRGANYHTSSDNSYWNFEVIEGTLPEGLYLYYGGILDGQFTTPCEAGSVTIRATDRAGTYWDTSDDEIVEFTIPYGACADKDRFLKVGDADPVEMKQDGSGTGWSYDAESSTLTLTNYNGGPIKAEKPFDLRIVGENTITVSNTVRTTDYYQSYGIWLETNSSANVTLSADGDARAVPHVERC